MYFDFSPPETDFSHETCCILVFVCVTRCMLIFLFMKFVHWFFFSWKRFCSWNMLRADYCSLNLLHADFSHVKLVVCWFISSWNFYIVFSPRETDFVCGTCCLPIFAPGAFCVMIFVRETCRMLIFSLWNF